MVFAQPKEEGGAAGLIEIGLAGAREAGRSNRGTGSKGGFGTCSH